MYETATAVLQEPTLESLINNIRESRDRINSAVGQTTEQICRLGFAMPAPVAPAIGSAMKDGGPGRERTAMERLTELAQQLESAAHDCECNHKNLQKQF